MSKEIKFKTVNTGVRVTSGSRACVGRIIHNESLSIDGIAADFAKFAKIDEHDARFYATYFADYIVKAAGEGKRLNFGSFSLYLSMKGPIDGANGRFDPKKNKLELNIRAYDKLSTALERLEPLNATLEDETLRITSIVDCELKEEGTLKSGNKVHVAGSTFLIDTTREDEGVWMEDDKGNRIVRCNVTGATATTLDFELDPGLAEGNYLVAVHSRMGDTSRPTPAVIRKKVKVVTQ